MKNIFKITTIIASFLLLMSCSKDETTIRLVTDKTEQGAWLRITDITGNIMDVNDPNSTLSLSFEYQDAEGSSLLESVDFSIIFVDKNHSNGNSSKTVSLGSLTAADFTKDSWGLPASSYSVTFGQALAALGLQLGDIKGTDVLTLSWDLNLTDGRTFTSADANGNVAAIGAYYSSPYRYTPAFKCGLTSTDPLFKGDFTVAYDEWADYGEGDVIPVTPDPDDPMSFRISNVNNPYISNGATSYIKVTVLDSNGKVSVSGNEDMCYNGWVCVTITGSGVINTCTGEINIDINFGPYSGYTLTLVKS